MPLWYWRGYDAGGPRQGYSLKPNLEAFFSEQDRGDNDILLTELRSLTARRHSSRRLRATGAPLARMTRLLALMLQADIPVAVAFEQLVEQSENRAWSHLMAAIAEDLEAGCGLHQAFARRGRFSDLYLAVLQAVEQGGQRGELLAMLADVLERDAAFRRRLLSAMLYPSVLLLAGLGAAMLMATWVIPAMRPLLGDEQQLPLLTSILLRLSEWVLGWRLGWEEIAALALVGLVGWRWRRLFAAGLERLPLVHQSRLAGAASVLTALQAGRVQLVSALGIAAASSGPVVGGALRQVRHRVERGVPLSSALRMQRQLPLLWSRLIRAGEVSGDYSRSFQMLRTLHQSRLQRMQALIERLAEPVLIAIIGAILTAVLLGLYLPILRAGTTL